MAHLIPYHHLCLCHPNILAANGICPSYRGLHAHHFFASGFIGLAHPSGLWPHVLARWQPYICKVFNTVLYTRVLFFCEGKFLVVTLRREGTTARPRSLLAGSRDTIYRAAQYGDMRHIRTHACKYYTQGMPAESSIIDLTHGFPAGRARPRPFPHPLSSAGWRAHTMEIDRGLKALMSMAPWWGEIELGRLAPQLASPALGLGKRIRPMMIQMMMMVQID